MNRTRWALILLTLAAFIGCKKDNVPNKIMDPLPLNTVETCAPGEVAQAFFLLKRDCLRVLIPIINRTIFVDSTFPELTGPDGQSRYTFQTSDRHYGTATFTIQFLDSTNAVIDPIQTRLSSTTLQSVDIGISGATSPYSINENLMLILEIAGLVNSDKRFTGGGTVSNTASTMSFSFTIPARGAFEGLIDGEVTATGSDSNGPASLRMAFYAEHTANGPIEWAGNSGGIHLQDNGSGTVITNIFRLLLD